MFIRVLDTLCDGTIPAEWCDDRPVEYDTLREAEEALAHDINAELDDDQSSIEEMMAMREGEGHTSTPLSDWSDATPSGGDEIVEAHWRTIRGVLTLVTEGRRWTYTQLQETR